MNRRYFLGGLLGLAASPALPAAASYVRRGWKYAQLGGASIASKITYDDLDKWYDTYDVTWVGEGVKFK